MIQTMTGNLQPLDQKFPIVTPDGRPTLYFIKWAQQKQIDIGAGITAEQALQIIELYLADHQLQAGSGIQITPSGNISDSPTIAAEVQAILDQITNVRGSVFFRGAAGWQALGPGTDGYFLRTNGAGADPSWAAGGGGGGMAPLARIITSGSQPVISFSALPTTGYASFQLRIVGRSTAAGTAGTILYVRLNGDTGSNYVGNRWNRFGNSSPGNRMEFGSIVANESAANHFDVLDIVFLEPLNSLIRKGAVSSSVCLDSGSYVFQSSGQWWTGTAAISQIDLSLSSGNFVDGSSATLYGFPD